MGTPGGFPETTKEVPDEDPRRFVAARWAGPERALGARPGFFGGGGGGGSFFLTGDGDVPWVAG